MIRVHGLSKRFGAQTVLQGVDLELRPGCVTALVGPNGAGKTTLVKLVLGLARADAGEMLFDGQPIAGEAYRSRIGYMPQIARFPENLTAAELLAMLRDLRGVGAATDEELIDRLALRGEMNKPIRVLSGGTRQKVNAVTAFLFRPDLLILDEPTAGLDPVSSSVLKDKIREERDAGRSFIISSHVMSELEEMADDVVFLLEGRVRYTGSMHDLKVRTRQFTLERAIAEMMKGEGEAA